MNRYKDAYQENFAHNDITVASHNRVNMRGVELAAALGPAVFALVIFFIFITLATLVYLLIAHAIVLEVLAFALVIGLVGGGLLLAAVTGINHMVRDTAKTCATMSFYREQPLRNNLITEKSGVVLVRDPHEEFRAINARDVTEHIHIAEKPREMLEDSDQAAERVTHLLARKPRKQEQDYEIDP